MRQLVAALLFSAIALALPDTAKAATITLDFTSALYSGAQGQASFSTTDQGVGVNLQASPSMPFASTLNYIPQGLGVNFPILPDDTEVGLGETLTINFDAFQFLDSFSLRLLFSNQNELEQGRYSLNGGAFVPFFANSVTGNLTVPVGQDGVSQIRFQAPGLVDDFAVSSINVATVPEPTSMILLGTGLLFGARRRYKMKQQ